MMTYKYLTNGVLNSSHKVLSEILFLLFKEEKNKIKN